MAASRAARAAPNPARIQWPWSLVALGWLVAFFATLTGQRALVDHHYLLEQSGLAWPTAAAVFLIGWLLMIFAMMLPVSAPLSTRTLDVSHVVGYVGPWMLFGLLAFTGDTGIHRLVDAWPWLAAHTFVIGATTFTLAGLFQFTPWKRACLTLCRAQRGTALDEPHTHGSWPAGLRHGFASVGSCWALMLIMFGVGVGGFGWMLGLTGVMLSESALPRAQSAAGARRLIGLALLALAALWLAHPAWLVPATAA